MRKKKYTISQLFMRTSLMKVIHDELGKLEDYKVFQGDFDGCQIKEMKVDEGFIILYIGGITKHVKK